MFVGDSSALEVVVEVLHSKKGCCLRNIHRHKEIPEQWEHNYRADSADRGSLGRIAEWQEVVVVVAGTELGQLDAGNIA